MSPFVLIIVFVVIWLLIKANSTNAKRKGDSMRKYQENFPFPAPDFDPFDNSREWSTPDSRSWQEGDDYHSEYRVAPVADEIEVPEVVSTTTGYRSIEFEKPTNQVEVAVEKFDLRRAVIYSEILKPKYNDNIF